MITNNEFDEVMEHKIKIDECINEETYEILKGKFSKCITSQLGSRILQAFISKSKKEIIEKIFDEIKNDMNELIIDQYGNYFCQKFFFTLSNENRIVFLEMVKYFLIKDL